MITADSKTSMLGVGDICLWARADYLPTHFGNNVALFSVLAEQLFEGLSVLAFLPPFLFFLFLLTCLILLLKVPAGRSA